MTQTWQKILQENLRLGLADPALVGDLDYILEWFSNHELGQSSEFSESLLGIYEPAQLRYQVEDFLDRLLFVDSDVLDKFFDHYESKDILQSRYRRIIRVFHPDKGEHSSDWLSYRTRIINDTLKAAKNGQLYNRESDKGAKRYKSLDKNKPYFNKDMSSRGLVRGLRSKVGDPMILQRKIEKGLAALIIACVFLVVALIL